MPQPNIIWRLSHEKNACRACAGADAANLRAWRQRGRDRAVFVQHRAERRLLSGVLLRAGAQQRLDGHLSGSGHVRSTKRRNAALHQRGFADLAVFPQPRRGRLSVRHRFF